MEIATIVLIVFLATVATMQKLQNKKLENKITQMMNQVTNVSATNEKFTDNSREMQAEIVNLQDELGEEREKNRTLLSQKKSSETRLGQISEHIVPFLENCPHDPKNMHFLGNPIDYIVFDFDDGKVTFLEVKSGNSKPSKRQKTIKNMIKAGRVYYEEIRINEKGVRTKAVGNVEGANQIQDNEEEDDGQDQDVAE